MSLQCSGWLTFLSLCFECRINVLVISHERELRDVQNSVETQRLSRTCSLRRADAWASGRRLRQSPSESRANFVGQVPVAFEPVTAAEACRSRLSHRWCAHPQRRADRLPASASNRPCRRGAPRRHDGPTRSGSCPMCLRTTAADFRLPSQSTVSVVRSGPRLRANAGTDGICSTVSATRSCSFSKAALAE